MSTFIIVLIIIAAILAGLVLWIRSMPPVGRVHISITDTKRFEMPARPTDDETFEPEKLD